MKSEFDDWFKAQHGPRPSRKDIAQLRRERAAASAEFADREQLVEDCDKWDARYTSALYAWQAARK